MGFVSTAWPAFELHIINCNGAGVLRTKAATEPRFLPVACNATRLCKRLKPPSPNHLEFPRHRALRNARHFLGSGLLTQRSRRRYYAVASATLPGVQTKSQPAVGTKGDSQIKPRANSPSLSTYSCYFYY